MKKIAVIKLGSRIAFGGTSGGSGEALSIIDMLVEAGAEVDAYTKVLKKDQPIPGVNVKDIIPNQQQVTENNYDALVIINGSVNFFGGAEDESQITNYKIINGFNGPVHYVYCDPSLTLGQIYPSVTKKEWGHKYTKDELLITKPIDYISQPKNVDIILQDNAKSVAKNPVNVKIGKITHHPFEKFPLMHDTVFDIPLSEKEYGILYGGTFRGGKRQDDMIKFYFNQNATMFGNIKMSNFSEKKIEKAGFTLDDAPKFEKAVKYNLFNEKMSKAVATVIIGDKYYKTVDDLAQRIYEAINAGVICFIDEDYDKTKRVFSNPVLRKFLYVKDGEDLRAKMAKIDTMTDKQYKTIIDAQRYDTELSGAFCDDFLSMI